MFHVYILHSEKDGRYYIGTTKNLARRIIEHYSGKTTSLRHRMPLVLVHVEAFSTNTLAVQRERYLKSLNHGNAFRKILEGATVGPLIRNTTRE